MSWYQRTRGLRFAAGVLQRRPFNVLIQVTNRCNLTCSFCDFWANGVHPREELTTDDYRKLSADLHEVGCFLVSIEGGEPLLRPDIVDIIQAFSQYHLPVLYTNGWFVDETLARELFAAGLHMVGVSIDFIDPDRHDQKRGRSGVWQRAWSAVDLLKEVAPRGGQQVHVMTVLMRENRSDWEPLLRQSAEHGVGHAFTMLSTQGFRRGDPSEEVPDSESAQALSALWRTHSHIVVPQAYLRLGAAFLEGGELPTCRAGQQSFNIDHVGQVSTCIEKIDQVVGNVRQDPLPVLLERLQGRTDVQHCQDCWTLCRGMSQLLSGGGSREVWRDLATRMRG